MNGSVAPIPDRDHPGVAPHGDTWGQTRRYAAVFPTLSRLDSCSPWADGKWAVASRAVTHGVLLADLLDVLQGLTEVGQPGVGLLADQAHAPGQRL